jgi:hypothetical protein
LALSEGFFGFGGFVVVGIHAGLVFHLGFVLGYKKTKKEGIEKKKERWDVEKRAITEKQKLHLYTLFKCIDEGAQKCKRFLLLPRRQRESLGGGFIFFFGEEERRRERT